MATVRLCLRCGYVNDWRRNSCLVCDTRLQPGFRRSDLKAGMHIEIKRLDRNLTAQRLGKGSVFITPDNKVGIVRRRLVTSIGFLRPPSLRHTSDHWVSPRHLDLRAIGVFVHDTVGILADLTRGVDWLIRLAAESVGRALGGPFVIEALLETGEALFWKVPRREKPNAAINEVVQAMSIGDLDFAPAAWERLEVD